MGSDLGNLECCVQECVQEASRQEFEQLRDGTPDSEDNTPVAGRGKIGEEGGEGEKCRAGDCRKSRDRARPFPQGAQGSPGKLDTCTSTPREDPHVPKIHLSSGGCQGNKVSDSSPAKWGDGNILTFPDCIRMKSL